MLANPLDKAFPNSDFDGNVHPPTQPPRPPPTSEPPVTYLLTSIYHFLAKAPAYPCQSISQLERNHGAEDFLLALKSFLQHNNNLMLDYQDHFDIFKQVVIVSSGTPNTGCDFHWYHICAVHAIVSPPSSQKHDFSPHFDMELVTSHTAGAAGNTNTVLQGLFLGLMNNWLVWKFNIYNRSTSSPSVDPIHAAGLIWLLWSPTYIHWVVHPTAPIGFIGRNVSGVLVNTFVALSHRDYLCWPIYITMSFDIENRLQSWGIHGQ